MTGLSKKILGISAAAIVVSAGMFVSGYAPANAAKGDLRNVISSLEAEQAPMRITLGKAELIDLPAGVSDVLVADPTVVDVQAVQSSKLYVVGLNIGDTNIIALDARGNVLERVDVHVAYDLRAIQSLINELFPNEEAKVSAVHDQILLTGSVSTPETASRISDLVAHYVSDLQDIDGNTDFLISNLLEVRGEQQVMLQVRIVEAKRNILKELGVDTNFNDPDELATTTIFGELPLNSTRSNGLDSLRAGGSGALTLSQDPVGIARGFFDTGINGIGVLGIMLDALEEEGFVNILAEPNLTAVSGQEAGFLAGGEFPVPTGRDRNGNIVVTFRQFGVSLNFRPTVLSDKRINLKMNTEVSSLDQTSAVELADVTVPGLDIRRAETTIELPSGGSLMIAGLLQSQTTDGFSGLPGISKTPVLGKLISSDSFQRNETELVVIVTGYLVEPYSDDENADKPLPHEKETELTRIFATNLRRHYDVEDEDVLDNSKGAFGYIVD